MGCLPKLSIASLDFWVSYQALRMPRAAGNAGRRNRTQSQVNIRVQAGWGGRAAEGVSFVESMKARSLPTWLPAYHLFLFPFSSVQFSLSVVSHSLRPHEPQHARPPCQSPTPGAHPNPCPLCWWCHPIISSSVVPFSSCPQSFPAPGSFPMSQLFASSGQSIGVSASTSVLPMNTRDWSPLGWTMDLLAL